MSEPQAPVPPSARPNDPLARQRERIAAAQARQAGMFANGRVAATAEARAASQAAARAEIAEVENLLATSSRMTILPTFAIVKAAESLKTSTQNVSDWRLTLEGHVFDRNAVEIAKARAQLAYWIERAQFDQKRLIQLAGAPLFPEPAEPAVPVPAPSPAPAPEQPVEVPVPVPVNAPAPPVAETAPAALAT